MFTKFNRVLLASGLVLTSLVGFGSSAFAESAPSEGSQEYQVPLLEKITYTPGDQIAPTVANVNTAVTGASVGSLKIESNDPDGFEVHAMSENGGKFIGTSNFGTEQAPEYKTIAYTLKYDGNEIETSLAASYSKMATEDFNDVCAGSGGAGTGCTRALTVDVAANADGNLGKPAGVYSDTITFKLISR
jgi:hypothetical protein